MLFNDVFKYICNRKITFVLMNVLKVFTNKVSKVAQGIAKGISTRRATSLHGSWSQNMPFILSQGGIEAYNNKIFFSAQNILVRKLTEAPIIFSKKKGTAQKVKLKNFYSSKITNEKRALIKAQSLVELEDHKLNDLFDNPNTYQSGIEMMDDFWRNHGLGDGFLYFETLGELSRDKRPIAIHSLNRDRVTPVKSDHDFDGIAYYKFTTLSGRQIDIDKEHILHLKKWNPNYGMLKGLGVDVISSTDIALNNANNLTQGNAFLNGGRGTLFSSDVAVTEEGVYKPKMTKEQKEDLQTTVESDYSGVRNYRKIHVTNGKVEVQQFGDTLAEMELVKSEENNWKNIFAICGVPWALAPITSSATENNVESGYKSLVTNTVLPEIKKFDQKLSQKIAQWFPGIIAVTDITEYSELTPDMKIMKDTYGSPLITVDEHRGIFNFDDLGGKEGKAIMVPSGFMNLKDLIDTSDFDTGDDFENL